MLFFIKDKFLTILLFFPLFLYFIFFDIRNTNTVTDLMVYNKISNYTNYYFYGISITLSVVLILLIDNEISIIKTKKKKLTNVYNFIKLKFIFYLITFIALIGTFINLSHVNFSFDLLFTSPRDYEMTFGSSTFINYLYFLSPISICIFLYLNHFRVKIKYGILLVNILFFTSFLHGVKFTVFDTVLIPSIFYFYLNNFKIKKRIPFTILFVLFLFYWTFSTFVRGSDDSDKTPIDQVISYVLPNYVNLGFSLSQKNLQWDGFSVFLPDKSPSILEKYYTVTEGGFVLNDAYNMETAYINYYRFAWYFGPFFFLLPVILIRRFVLKFGNFNIANLFYLTMIDFCLLFVFFFHAFIKTKYWYFVILVFIIHLISKTKRTREVL
jgi:hypothetical protein